MATVQITYAPAPGFNNGTDSFPYTIDDGHGGQATATVTVNVHNAAPIAGPDNASTHGEAVTVNVLANDSDPDGDPLTGPTPKVGPFNGTIVVNGDGTVTYTPFNTFHNGSDTWTYTITDGHGGSTDGVLTINVHNANPVAANYNESTHGTPVTTNVLANDTDSDQDTLTVTSAGNTHNGNVVVNGGSVTYTPAPGFYNGNDSYTYTIDDGHGGTATGSVFVNVHNAPPVANNDSATTHGAVTIDELANDSDSDGDTLSVLIQQGSQHGSVTINPDKTITYVPSAGQSQNDSFVYKIDDGHGGTATATVTITVTNAAPVANDDAVTLAHNQTSITIPVQANDTDADSDTLSFQSLQGNVNTHGNLLGNADGTVTYTVAGGYFGPTASFTYSLRDGHGGTSNVATVTVNLATPPTDTPYSASTHGDPVTINVLANAADVDSDTVTFAGACGATNSGTQQPQQGFCQVAPGGLVTYTPNGPFDNWFPGETDTFTYRVSDGHGGFAFNTVTITFVNTPPVALDQHYTINTGQSLTLTDADLRVGDTDAESDSLYRKSRMSVTRATARSHRPCRIRAPTRRIRDFAGIDSFTFHVLDGHGGDVVATAYVTVNAPTTVTVNAPAIVYGADGVVTVTVRVGCRGGATGWR